MKLLRRAAATVAATVLTLGIVSMAAPAHADRDTGWDLTGAQTLRDTGWDLTGAQALRDTGWDLTGARTLRDTGWD
jgi:hypothetical protein